MIFRKILTRKAAEVVESVAEPAKKVVNDHIENVKKAVGDRSDWGAKLAKFGIGLVMLLFTFKESQMESPKQPSLPAMPSTITINNYVNDKRERSNKE